MSIRIDLSPLTRLHQALVATAGDGAVLRDLLNLIEQLIAENQAQGEELQRLRDEINRLKGEQGKPTLRQAQGRLFKPKGPPAGGTNYSSEQERRQPKTWQKGRKLDQIKIDRVERRLIDPATLPPDAVFKGTETVTVQDPSASSGQALSCAPTMCGLSWRYGTRRPGGGVTEHRCRRGTMASSAPG